ncbi:hypothetical protein AAG565_11300 [Fontimonas sp. SYSU GA230001]|uniref:hypothetical protein n=1 Tax=Fontimonas sp. SYSU GA230001 TaxID=3142450 RepID=UPI0032B3C6A0
MTQLIHNTNKNVLRAAALAALLGFSGLAAADDGLTQRVATGVGRVIAAQGNAALTLIREELDQTIQKTIQPWLPTPDVQASTTARPELAPSAPAAL